MGPGAGAAGRQCRSSAGSAGRLPGGARRTTGAARGGGKGAEADAALSLRLLAPWSGKLAMWHGQAQLSGWEDAWRLWPVGALHNLLW